MKTFQCLSLHNNFFSSLMLVNCNLHGGTGKYGFESDKMLLNSAILLIIMNGEHLGTGAGTVGSLSNRRSRHAVTYKSIHFVCLG